MDSKEHRKNTESMQQKRREGKKNKEPGKLEKPKKSNDNLLASISSSSGSRNVSCVMTLHED